MNIYWKVGTGVINNNRINHKNKGSNLEQHNINYP